MTLMLDKTLYGGNDGLPDSKPCPHIFLRQACIKKLRLSIAQSYGEIKLFVTEQRVLALIRLVYFLAVAMYCQLPVC